MVWLVITHSLFDLKTEKQFSESLTVEQLKQKLYSIVGTEPQYMTLQLFANDEDTKPLVKSLEDNMTLLSYGIQTDRMRIHVIDKDPNKQDFGDVSQVEKYVMSEEDYDARDNTFRKWKKKHIDPYVKPKEPTKEEEMFNNPEIIQGIKKGDRCEIQNEIKSRGTVKFVGKVSHSTGYWVGVQLDEPIGNNDGSVKGKRYFLCPQGFGTFSRPTEIKVGDYPEESYDFEEI
ncbi:hypothetical protein ABK040_000058 [Willaertia magna]